MHNPTTGYAQPVPDALTRPLAARNRLVIRPRKIPPTQAEIDHLECNVRLAAEAYRRLVAAGAGQAAAPRMDHRGGPRQRPVQAAPETRHGCVS